MENDLIDNEFNPELWTHKELLRHLYRELKIINTKIDAYELQHSSSISVINERIKIIENWKTKVEAIKDTNMKWYHWLGWVIGGMFGGLQGIELIQKLLG